MMIIRGDIEKSLLREPPISRFVLFAISSIKSLALAATLYNLAARRDNLAARRDNLAARRGLGAMGVGSALSEGWLSTNFLRLSSTTRLYNSTPMGHQLK
jgi:hypothetical protein